MKPARSELLCVSRRAMACDFEVLIPAAVPDALDAAGDALDLVDELESQLTAYRETSEVSRLNRLAAHGPTPIEPRLFELLSLSAKLWKETEGAFDITAGALTKAWGFFQGPRRVPSTKELEAARQKVGMQYVVLTPPTAAKAGETPKFPTAQFLRAGLEINLGAIGKGYALDRASELLREKWKVPCALLHGGSSSVYGLGSPPHDSRGWVVGVADPRDPNFRLGHIRLKDRALGTSAATFQHLEHEGRKLGHLLDPRTGRPAEGMLGVSVAARTAAAADALATAFFILGMEKARAYCESHPEIGAVLTPTPIGGQNVRPLPIGRMEPEIYAQPQRVRDEGP